MLAIVDQGDRVYQEIKVFPSFFQILVDPDDVGYRNARHEGLEGVRYGGSGDRIWSTGDLVFSIDL